MLLHLHTADPLFLLAIVMSLATMQRRYPDSIVVWNCDEFQVRFRSLDHEIKIGGFFLRNYLEEIEKHGMGKESHVCPTPFLPSPPVQLGMNDKFTSLCHG